MKCIIITGHFVPSIGYQEVHLANAISLLGHEVTVLTTTSLSPNSKRVANGQYKSGVSKDEVNLYQIVRLRPLFSHGAIVIAVGLTRLIKSINPDVILVVGLSKIFPIPALFDRLKSACLISIFGDNPESLVRSKQEWYIVKRFHVYFYKLRIKILYNYAVKKCDWLIMNVPTTLTIFDEIIYKRRNSLLKRKALSLHLGFDSSRYYFSNLDRKNKRRLLGLQDNTILFVTSTRVTPVKKVEEIILSINELIINGLDVHYLIIGCLGDPYESSLKRLILIEGQTRFTFLPFLDSEEIRKYYCAADYGIWMRPAISIIEAMGTGLRVILSDSKSLDYLIASSELGFSFSNGQLASTLTDNQSSIMVDDIEQRRNRSKKFLEEYSYNSISEKILSLSVVKQDMSNN